MIASVLRWLPTARAKAVLEEAKTYCSINLMMRYVITQQYKHAWFDQTPCVSGGEFTNASSSAMLVMTSSNFGISPKIIADMRS